MFCTTDDVKAHIQTASSYTGDDALITTHIKLATALIRKFTRRNWERQTFTQFFGTEDINTSIRRGDNVLRFTLKEKPLVSVTEVKYNTGGEWANTDAIDAADYEVDLNANAVIIYPWRSSSSARSVRIKYVAGYEVNGGNADLLDVDEHIKQACAHQAAFSFRRVVNETSNVSLKQDRKGLSQYKVGPSGLVMEAQALVRGEAALLVGGNG